MSEFAEIDHRTVAALYDEHVALIYGYLRASGVAEAEDLTAAVFIAMARELPNSRRDTEAFRVWLLKLAHDHLVDHRRRRRIIPVVPLDQNGAAWRPGPRSSAPGHTALEAATIERFAWLTPEQREVLALRFVGGLDLAVVAAILERPVTEVASTQHRALAALIEPDEAERTGEVADGRDRGPRR